MKVELFLGGVLLRITPFVSLNHRLQHVVFGKVVNGMDIVKEIEKYGSESGRTKKQITISDCGQIHK